MQIWPNACRSSADIEQENLPPVVRGWIKAIGLGEHEMVELVMTEREVLLRRPSDPSLRAWAKSITDQYDATFRELLDL